MRRGLLPVLLFLLAAGGTLFLGTRILASERVSAERTARERLRAGAAEAAGILRGAALATVHGDPVAIASVSFLTERSRGAVVFEQPDEPTPLGRLATGRDPEAGFYLAEGERAEAVERDLDRAEGLYRSAAAEGRDPTARCIALYRIAALERRRSRSEAAKAAESGFLALAVGLDRATLEVAVVGARARALGPDLQGLLIAAVGTPDECVALGLLRDAGVAADRTIGFRREQIALLGRLRPLVERAFDERPLGEGAVVDGERLVAWRRGPEPTRMHIMVQPLPVLPGGVRIQASGEAVPSQGEIAESVPVLEPLRGVVVAASTPREAIEAAARRGAWLLGGALAALLLAGGAAFVLSVRAARREAEAARARADFVTKMGHDLRTPLAVVRMYAETLAAGRVADPAEAREFASIAAREAERLTGMVGQVLDLSRVSEGTPALARRTLDLAAVVEEVAAVHRPLLEHAGMTLAVTVERPLPVLGDSASLRGAVSNLLENAGRHAAAGGSVAVEAVREGRMAVLRVLDRGPGIPAGLEESVFERFVRGPGAVGSGAGLGLALVREATEAHGGAAAASNREGGGAIFEVRLPLAEKEGA